MARLGLNEEEIQKLYNDSVSLGEVTPEFKKLIRTINEKLVMSWKFPFDRNISEFLLEVNVKNFERLINLYPYQDVNFAYISQVIKKLLYDVYNHEGGVEGFRQSWISRKRELKINQLLDGVDKRN